MTEWVHLVIVRRWNYEAVAGALEEALGNVDPADPKGKKRLSLIQAATRLFLKQGYRKTSVAEVAREAGMAKGTVYLYFSTKIDLVVAAICLEKREFLGRMRDLFEEDLEPRVRLTRYLVLTFVIANDMPLVSRLVGGDQEWLALLADLPQEVMNARQDMGLDFFGEMVEECVGKERWNSIEREDRAKVLMSLGAFSGLIANAPLRSGLSLERYATILAEMIVDGLMSRGGVGQPEE